MSSADFALRNDASAVRSCSASIALVLPEAFGPAKMVRSPMSCRSNLSYDLKFSSDMSLILSVVSKRLARLCGCVRD